MLLYCTPGGTWAGTEAAWKAALKAEGVDHKTQTRKQIDVPTSKAALLEFLTFHGVNPIGGRLPAPQVTGGEAPPTPLASPPVAPAPLAAAQDAADLDALFDEAPIAIQLRLAMFAVNRAKGLLTGTPERQVT